MPILTTCHSNRDYDRILTADAYRGVLPTYQELRSGTDPMMAFVDAVRAALSLHYKAQLGTLSRLFSPTAAAWSAREIGATYAMVRVWFGEQTGGIKELFECVGEAQTASAALSRTFSDADRYGIRDE
jgi:hypothetical protein